MSLQKKVTFELQKCEEINEIDEFRDKEVMKDHMSNLLEQLKVTKKSHRQLSLQEKIQTKKNKQHDNLMKNRLYDRSIIERDQFNNKVSPPKLFHGKPDSVHLPVSGVIGNRERFELLSPERAKNPTNLKINSVGRNFEKVPFDKLTEKEQDRQKYWQDSQQTQKDIQYEELIKEQSGKYRKKRISSLYTPKPFQPTDQKKKSISVLDSNQYSLGDVSKLHFNEITKNRMIKKMQYNPFSARDSKTYTHRHKTYNGKYSKSFNDLDDDLNSSYSQNQSVMSNNFRNYDNKDIQMKIQSSNDIYLDNEKTGFSSFNDLDQQYNKNNGELPPLYNDQAFFTQLLQTRQKIKRDSWKPTRGKSKVFDPNASKLSDFTNQSLNCSKNITFNKKQEEDLPESINQKIKVYV